MPADKLVITLILLLFFGPTAGVAGDTSATSGADHATADEQQPPSDELLEFLGQWETDKGIWVDPADLDWLMQTGDGLNDDE